MQATEADHKDDREVICGEVFDDINGILDETSQGNAIDQRICAALLQLSAL